MKAVSKNLVTILLVICMVFISTLVYAATEANVAGTLASKKSYVVDAESGEYKIELKVPGADGEELHDEVILMVDGSYSMDNEWPAMKAAIIEIGKAFLNGNGNTQLTLMAFGVADNEVLVHIKSVEELEESLGELPGTLLYGVSATNCEAGFTGVAEYIDAHDDTLNSAHVIFISDGNINTDETPYIFYNWKENTWYKKYPIETILNNTLASECKHILNGGSISEAFATVFGSDADAQTVLETATEEQKMQWIDLVWENVYEDAGLVSGEAYPVSDVERAFATYDKKYNTDIEDVFLYSIIERPYPDRWTRTPAAANELAAKEKVTTLHLVDYDSYSAWMDTGVTAENATFIKSDGIDGLIEALKGEITNLSKTPYNDVVVTDYMSKWVVLDTTSIAIVDDTAGEVIYTVADGWLIPEEERPTAEEVPVKIELVDASEYELGGENVVGNKSEEIYKLTWYVKDGAMLRSENYHLEYTVKVDSLERGFRAGKEYPANGNTTIKYVDENGEEQEEDIEVPTVKMPKKTECGEDKPQKPGCGEDKPQKPGCGEDKPQKPGCGEDKPQKPSCGEDKPEKPGCGEDKPEKPGCGEDKPQEPSCGEDKPEKPGCGEDKPQKPGCGEDKPQKPGCGEDKPQKPGCGEDKPQEPSCGEDKPQEPSCGENKPQEPSCGEDRPQEPSCGENKPQEPNCGEDRPQEPSCGENKPQEPNCGEDRPQEPSCGEDKPQEPGCGENKPQEPNCGENKPQEPSCDKKENNNIGCGR